MPRDIVRGSNLIKPDKTFQSLLINTKYGRRNVHRPLWDFTALVIRPLPSCDNHKTRLSPFKDEYGEPGEWIGKDAVVATVSGGVRAVQYMIKHMYDGMETLENSPTYQLNTYLERYRKVLELMHSANSDDREKANDELQSLKEKVWKRFKRDSETQVDVKTMEFIQCVPLVVRSQVQYDHVTDKGVTLTGLAPLVMLTKSAQISLRQALQVRPGEEEVDLIDPKNGAFLQITRSGTNKKSWYPSEGEKMGNTYDVEVFKIYDKYYPKFEGNVFDHITPWDSVFNLLSPEEELSLLVWSGIPSIYLYVALADSFNLPNQVIKDAREELGYSSITVNNFKFSDQEKTNVEDQIDVFEEDLPLQDEEEHEQHEKNVEERYNHSVAKPEINKGEIRESEVKSLEKKLNEVFNRVENKNKSEDSESVKDNIKKAIEMLKRRSDKT